MHKNANFRLIAPVFIRREGNERVRQYLSNNSSTSIQIVPSDYYAPDKNLYSTSSRRFPSPRRSCRTEIRPILTGIKRSFWKLCEVASKSSSTGCHRIPRVDALFPTTPPSKPSFCHSARCILSYCNIFKSKRNRGRTTKCCRFVVLSVCVLVCVLVYVCVSLCVSLCVC